jgi:hypothetical protein
MSLEAAGKFLSARSIIMRIKLRKLHRVSTMSAGNVAALLPKPTQTPLQDVQNNFALIDLSGAFYILKRRKIHELLNGIDHVSLNYYKDKEGKLVIRRYIEAQAYGLEDKEVSLLLTNFMKSANTHVYSSVAFDPRPQSTEVLNLWRPHAIQPVPGCFALIEAFLFEIICDGDLCSYNYLLYYLAHMLQKPEEKPMVAIILLGGARHRKGRLLHSAQDDMA